MTYVVIDKHYGRAYGPFETIEKAEDWLSVQGINPGSYADQECCISELTSPMGHQMEALPYPYQGDSR